MPLFRRKVSPVVSAPTSRMSSASDQPGAIVAAATVIDAENVRRPFRVQNSAWAYEAWRQYDICGELHFATNWLANSSSRVRLVVVNKDGKGALDASNTDDARVIELLKGLIGNRNIQSEIVRQATINLTVTGDFYLLAEADILGVFSKWTVLSTQEISLGTPEGWVIINLGDGEPRRIFLDDVLLMRVHRPHPRQWWQADSPTRAALPVLRELEELSKYLFATINSRLSGAGILGMPSEMTFPAPVQEIEPGQSAFMAFLTEAMLAPIEDMSDPASVVPIVIEAPREALAGMVWLTNPNSGLPPLINELRQEALRRLAMTLDLAPEMLLGSANSNHWGQWAIEEQSIKFHVEPGMLLLCSALTSGWMTPILEAAGVDASKYQIWYDPSDLVQRTDQGAVALDVFDRGELSGEALLRETGFPESDRPTGNEREIRALEKAISLAPQIADLVLPELLRLLGIDPKVIKAITPDPAGGTPPQVKAPDKNDPARPLPDSVTKPGPTKTTNPPRKDGKPGERSTS